MDLVTNHPDGVAETPDGVEAPAPEGAPTVAQRHALSAESAPALLALYSAIVEELHGRGLVRSTNNPVGDYAEYLTARAFGLSLAGNSSIGYDAVSDDGIRYQVKSRRLTPRNSSRQLSAIRGLESGSDPFDFLVGILFTRGLRGSPRCPDPRGGCSTAGSQERLRECLAPDAPRLRVGGTRCRGRDEPHPDGHCGTRRRRPR